MATYIPNITDVFPEPYIFKPDLAFYDKMLQRKTALYEQGVAKAKSAYESVLNAPLSNKYNIPIRDQYIKQAREQLTKMAGLDFSQPQNIAAARNVFSPFWEDKFIVKDAELTKAYQTQASILDGWKNNSDPKVRENYSGIAAQYLNNGLEGLVNAERTDDGFSKIEKRKAVPFTNIQKYLNEAAEKEPEKLKIVWDSVEGGGPYLISLENGKRSKKPFAEWARAQIGNNFYEQFNVTGTVETESRVKRYKNQFPNLSDAEINEKIADDVLDETDKFFQKRKDAINVQIARIDGLVTAMPKSLTKEDREAIRQYRNEKTRLMGDLAEVDKEYQIDFEKDRRQQLRSNIILDPKGYFSIIAKERVVENFAAGRSSIESRKIKSNEAYFNAFDIQEKNRRYELDVLQEQRQKTKDDRDWIKTQWDMSQPGKTSSRAVGVNSQGQAIDKDGNVIPEIQGEDVKTGGLYTGLSVTSPLKTGTAAENFERDQKKLFYSGFDLIFNNDGLLRVAKKGLGLTDLEVTQVSSALQQEMRSRVFNPEAPEYKFTPEQKTASNKLAKLLEQDKYVQEAGIKVTGPVNLQKALIAYTNGYLQDRKKDGEDIDMDDEEMKALFVNYTTAVNNLERYRANEDNRNKMISDYAKKNPKDAERFFIKKDDGTYNLATTQSLAQIPEIKQFKDITVTSYAASLNIPMLPIALERNIPATYKINPSEIAEALLNGKLKFITHTSDKQTLSGAKTVTDIVIETGDKPYMRVSEEDAPKVKQMIDSFRNRFGKENEFGKKYNEIYQSAVPNLLYHQQKTGTVSPEFSYTFNKKQLDDKAFVTFNEALNTSNATMYILDANNNFKQADSKVANAIINMFQNKEETAEQYVQGFSYTPIDGRVGGKPSIKFTLGAISDANKLGSAGINLTELSKNTFVMAIEDTDRLGSNLKDLPRNSGFYMYEPLFRGQQIKSDNMLRTLGYEYTITPDFDGSDPNQKSTTGRAELKYLVRTNTYDKATGQLKSEVTSRTIPSVPYDLSTQTPDEFVNGLLRIISQQIQENTRLKKEYNDWLDLQKNKPQDPNNENQIVDKDKFLRELGY